MTVRSGSRGFALVIVLLSLAMLALLGTELTATARLRLRLAAQTRDQAMAEAAADGATREATFILLGGGRIGSGGAHARIGEAAVTILADDEADKINPNLASSEVLRGLLAAVGVDQARAARLAGELADWRTTDPLSVLGGLKLDQYRDRGLPYRSADHGFYSVDEMGLVPDMTPDVLARLRPRLSIWHEGDVSDPGGASPAAAAISDAAADQPGAAGPDFVSDNLAMRLTAVAVIPGRARFVRSAVVRLRLGAAADGGAGDSLVQVLDWE